MLCLGRGIQSSKSKSSECEASGKGQTSKKDSVLRVHYTTSRVLGGGITRKVGTSCVRPFTEYKRRTREKLTQRGQEEIYCWKDPVGYSVECRLQKVQN